jgi:hypothetical protein
MSEFLWVNQIQTIHLDLLSGVRPARLSGLLTVFWRIRRKVRQFA